MTNIGEDEAIGAELTDAIPLGTTYVPGSLRIDGAVVTDTVDADRGDVAAGKVRATLGVPAGRLPVGSTAQVRFQVQITADNPDGASILNVAGFSYRGAKSPTGSSPSGIPTAPRGFGAAGCAFEPHPTCRLPRATRSPTPSLGCQEWL